MKYIFLLVQLFLMIPIWGQDISPNIIASAGNTIKNNTYQIAFTLGEPLVYKITNESGIAQGFWEVFGTEKNVLSIGTFDLIYADIKIYPNPVKTALMINARNVKDYQIRLFSVAGNEIRISKIHSSFLESTIDLSFLASGLYILQLSTLGTTLNKKFKIHKR